MVFLFPQTMGVPAKAAAESFSKGLEINNVSKFAQIYVKFI